jgi:XapX domain-containing protein
MKIYLLSAGAGVLVGVIYGILNVRSPAPPLVALVGLLGILIGEQIFPVSKQLLSGSSFLGACQDAKCASHLFGMLPGRQQDGAASTASTAISEHFEEKTP